MLCRFGSPRDTMGTNADRYRSHFCRFTSEMARSRTDIMTSNPNEGPMPTDCADTYMCRNPTLLIGGD
jgi:hypothetical protein